MSVTEAEIEAAARAIRAAFARRIEGADRTPTAWDDLYPWQRNGYREEAKVAIIAAEHVRNAVPVREIRT